MKYHIEERQLPLQIHCSDESVLKKEVVPVKNSEKELWFNKKPAIGTGFWTSSVSPYGASEWIQYAKHYPDLRLQEKYWHLVVPKEQVLLLVLENYADVELLMECYGLRSPHISPDQVFYDDGEKLSRNINFEKLSQEYDGIHLPSHAVSLFHLGWPYHLQWDVESTLWFHWCFAETILIKKPEEKMMDIPHYLKST